ncbi:hypothetical protein F7725_001558 [Dissostichus mawsoni]|uniref:Uncharacterized protein n=1 Tax=Dissostichus mawsoni TaxID=36200 RepID=A0A7J5Y1P0_DISMA|nr:hypothetical protein F7725_001558 [Dissostichus mawsoni]
MPVSLLDEEIIFRSWDGDIMKANTHSNETQLLLKNTTFATFKASTFAVSPDLNFVLLGYDVKQVVAVLDAGRKTAGEVGLVWAETSPLGAAQLGQFCRLNPASGYVLARERDSPLARSRECQPHSLLESSARE